MYIMLSDCPPFYGNDEKEILKRVEVGKYTFNLPQWNKVGEPAKHLIRMMMFYVPAMRISAEQSLEHEWIRRYIGDTSKKLGQHLHLLIESMNNIPVFLSSGRLGQIVLLYSASKLTESVETETYVNAFHALDNKGKGRLDKQDLIDGYMAIIGRGKPSKVDEDELNKQVDALLAAVDQDDSGMITNYNHQQLLRSFGYYLHGYSALSKAGINYRTKPDRYSTEVHENTEL